MFLVALSLSACNGTDDGTDDGDTRSTADTADTAPPSATLLLEDASNFSWTHAETIPTFSVSVGADFPLSWGGVSEDVWGRPLAAADVFGVDLALRTEDVAALKASLALHGAAPELAVERWELAYLTVATTTASQLSHTGHPFVPTAAQAGQNYVASLTDEEGKMLQAAVVTFGGGTDAVVLEDARLNPALVLSERAVRTAASLGPWTIDWSGLTRDANGDPLDPTAVETLYVARFADASSVDLIDPQTADGYWVKYVPGRTSIDPAEMSDLAGDGFPGFTADGVWVVGFRCVNCTTALPRYAVRVDVVP